MRAIRVGTRVVFVRLFGFFFYYYFPVSLSDDRLRRVFSIRLSTAERLFESGGLWTNIYRQGSDTRQDWVTNFPRVYYILYYFMGVSGNYRTSELSQSSFYLYYFFSVYIMYRYIIYETRTILLLRQRGQRASPITIGWKKSNNNNNNHTFTHSVYVRVYI